MDKSHKQRVADTEAQGREPNEFEPLDFDGLPMERPMDSGDMSGAATPPDPKNPHKRARYQREVALKAWEYLEHHNPDRPLPDWVAAYLRKVATSITSELGPRGSLSPASAHAALGVVGEQWPEHHPESVYAIISAWIDPDRPGGPLVNGRKAGAVRYIEEYMNGDRDVQLDTVIEWYRKGQKARKGEPDQPPREEEFLGHQHKNSPTRIIVSPRR